MTKEELKKAVCEAIEKRFDDIKAFGESIFAEPELGYKEYKTSAKVKKAFDELGISYTDGWGINGVKGRMKGTKSDRTVAVFGELTPWPAAIIPAPTKRQERRTAAATTYRWPT